MMTFDAEVSISKESLRGTGIGVVRSQSNGESQASRSLITGSPGVFTPSSLYTDHPGPRGELEMSDEQIILPARRAGRRKRNWLPGGAYNTRMTDGVRSEDELILVLRRDSLEAENGCLIWTGTIGPNGYGDIYVGNRSGSNILRRVHRVAWELKNGPIPDGMVLDHQCEQRRCFRIQHLQLVTPAENSRRLNKEARIAALDSRIRQLTSLASGDSK